MHITLESDYAVRIVYCLAQNGGRMEAAAIAEQTGVTLEPEGRVIGEEG